MLGLQDGTSARWCASTWWVATPIAHGAGEDLLAGKSNYLVGSQDQWHTDIANYGAVRYDNVYDGIDLRYYGNQRQLEYDFVVNAGADPTHPAELRRRPERCRSPTTAISWSDARQRGSHDLLQGAGRLPGRSQRARGGGEPLPHRRRRHGRIRGRRLRCQPPARHRSGAVYGTYFGGTGGDVANGIAVDTAGNVYLTGYTLRPDSACFSVLNGGGNNVFVTKFSPNLGSVIYSTYVGGSGRRLSDQHRGRRERERLCDGLHDVQRLPNRLRLPEHAQRLPGRVRVQAERGRAPLWPTRLISAAAAAATTAGPLPSTPPAAPM